jgi:hypothetical protein
MTPRCSPGVDLFLASQSGVEEAFSAAIAADRSFALAHVGLARNSQGFGHPQKAKQSIAMAGANGDKLTRRKVGHLTSLGLLIDGDGPRAYEAIRNHLNEHPLDVMVAQTCTGVFGLIGFSVQAGREAEQLAFTCALALHYGDDRWFGTLHVFGQMEAGQIGLAEETTERSLRGNARNKRFRDPGISRTRPCNGG